MIRLFMIMSVFMACNVSDAQNPNMADYNDQWEATFNPKALSFDLELTKLSDNQWRLQLSNDNQFYDKKLKNIDGDMLYLQLDKDLYLQGSFLKSNVIEGYIKTNNYQYHITLNKDSNGHYTGKWNSFYVDEVHPAKMLIAFEDGNGDNYAAYPMMLDNRYRGTYVAGFQKDGNQISFFDRNSGIRFLGLLNGDEVEMKLMLGGEEIATLNFERSTVLSTFGSTANAIAENVKNPDQLNDQISTGQLADFITESTALDKMVDSIEANTLTNVHSVLIAKEGKLIYENYFNGFHRDIPHDQRSAAKSIGSAIVGIAMDEGVLKSVNESIYNYLPNHIQYTKSDKKAGITIKHLLTMSSGLDAIDFGIDRMGQATEDNYQQSDNWLKTVLEAPMIFEPGEQSNYGSANPYLLSAGLSNVLDRPLLEYMDEKLFGPLGFSNYSVSLDDNGDPYFGGGSYLIPRDMLKFGELYRNKGLWNNQRLISESWIAESFEKHDVLENTNDKNEYGYLWWHHTYNVKGRQIHAVEARGAGGQYISIIDELDMTIIITSGNYFNGRFWQPELILEKYILPDFVK